jgi:POT family proton-dependent oligopeptide transporter
LLPTYTRTCRPRKTGGALPVAERLSSITKLAPRDRLGQMMGVWFIAAALGNLFAGIVAGRLEDLPPASLFSNVAMFVGVSGIIALFLSPGVKRLMGDIK